MQPAGAQQSPGKPWLLPPCRGTSSELRGTINDAHSIQRLLVKYFGFGERRLRCRVARRQLRRPRLP